MQPDPYRVVGNAFASDAPPEHFRHFLVGDLQHWAAKNGLAALELARKYSMLSTRALEVKIAYEDPGNEGPDKPDGDTPPFMHTLGVVLSGHMNITLKERASGDSIEHKLVNEADFLGWAGSVYSHTWRCIERALVVTVRWPE